MLAGSSGFRAPNIDDLSKVFDSSPGNVVVRIGKPISSDQYTKRTVKDFVAEARNSIKEMEAIS